MRNILLLALNSAKVLFRKKSNIVVYILLPIVIIFAMMKLFGDAGASKITMGIVNKDNTVISKNMVEFLEDTGKFDIQEVNEADINDKIASRKLDFAFVIPENFGEGIYSGKARNIKIISIKGIEATAWIENYSNFYIKNLMDIYTASKGDKETFNKIYEGYKNETFKFKSEAIKDTKMKKIATKQSLGMLIMFILIACSNTASFILKEKVDRTYHRICTTPITPRGYVAGNVLVNLLIVFTQIVLAIILMENVLNVETYVPTLQMIVILMSFGLAAVGLGMVIMAFSNSSNASGAISSLVVTPTCMLSGCFWPVELMPKAMQKISYFIPQRWVLDAVSKIQSGKSFADVQINIFILLSFAAAFFLIAAYKIKKSDNVKKFV